jgi:hypothetical protein
MGRRGYQPADLVVELGRLGGQHPLAVACSVWPWCVAGEVPAGTGTATLLNVRERHLSISHELPVALALLTTRLLHSMVEVVVEGDHGVVGAEGGQSPGRARGGCGVGQIAQVGGHGAGVAVPSGHVRVVGTVAVVWMSSRRHGCGTAKAPGREPGPCCWPPRGGQTGGMLLLSPQGTTVSNSA